MTVSKDTVRNAINAIVGHGPSYADKYRTTKEGGLAYAWRIASLTPTLTDAVEAAVASLGAENVRITSWNNMYVRIRVRTSPTE